MYFLFVSCVRSVGAAIFLCSLPSVSLHLAATNQPKRPARLGMRDAAEEEEEPPDRGNEWYERACAG